MPNETDKRFAKATMQLQDNLVLSRLLLGRGLLIEVPWETPDPAVLGVLLGKELENLGHPGSVLSQEASERLRDYLKRIASAQTRAFERRRIEAAVQRTESADGKTLAAKAYQLTDLERSCVEECLLDLLITAMESHLDPAARFSDLAELHAECNKTPTDRPRGAP